MNIAKQIKQLKTGSEQWSFMARRISMKTKELLPKVSSKRDASLNLDQVATETTISSGMEM